MIAISKIGQPQQKRVRITLDEARVLTTAVTISIIQTPPPDCCYDTLEALMNRILAAFCLDVELDAATGNIIVDGQVVAEPEESDEA